MSDGGIQSRVPWTVYCAMPGTRVSLLKELRRSAKHYRYRKHNPKQSNALRLGTAAHCAVLEPERFAADFAIWTRRTDSGRMAPRAGKEWDAFQKENDRKTVLTEDEFATAMDIQNAVRSHPVAMQYLTTGDPEVTMQWLLGDHLCKGRVDWLTEIAERDVIVGLKTSRDARHYIFGSQAAKLGYHLQWAYYCDGFHALTRKSPKMVEIVVESEPPHDVAVYNIPGDIIEQGRDEYLKLLGVLQECERTDEWPGSATMEQDLTLPSWAYESHDDLTDIGLEA